MAKERADDRWHKLSVHSGMTGSRGLALVVALLVATPHARALQPLEEFVDGARSTHPDARAAALLAVQRDAEALAARGALLPSVSATGTYTLNQYEAALDAGAAGRIVVQPRHGVGGSLQLTVPLVDLAAWRTAGAADAAALASERSAEASTLGVAARVATAYYQLIGAEALQRSVAETLAAAEQNLALTREKLQHGTATELDVARATVEVEGARRNLAAQEIATVLGRRTLSSLTGMAPTGDTPDLADDLHDEPPLGDWEARAVDTPVVAAAESALRATEAQAAAARLTFLPKLTATGLEQATNAAGFAGHDVYFTGMLALSWRLDVPTFARNRAAGVAVEVARTQAQRARQDALDAVHEAWQRVRVGVASCRAARAQADAARLAARVAGERYDAGASTQLDVVQAQRDLAASAAVRIQSEADLALARVLLRLTAGGL